MKNAVWREVMALCIALGAGWHPEVVVQARTSNAAPAISAADVIDAVNALRASHGLPAYSVSSTLMGTAQAQASYMASTGIIQHTGPGGSRPYQRGLAAGYPLAGQIPPGFFSENIQAGPDLSPSAAVQIWTGDEPHLNTMISPMLQEIGAGVAESDGMIYYVIDCARPTTDGLPPNYTPGIEGQFSGADVIMPVTMSTPDATGALIHEVKQGQSLWQIAVAYGVKIDEIRSLNQLAQSYQIQPGDKLLIKRVGTATPLPPSPTVIPTSPSDTPVPTVSLSAVPEATKTPLPQANATVQGGATATGAAVGAIVLTALVAAALVAWAGRSRPV
jgi:uncharacterized protein YkwD